MLKIESQFTETGHYLHLNFPQITLTSRLRMQIVCCCCCCWCCYFFRLCTFIANILQIFRNRSFAHHGSSPNKWGEKKLLNHYWRILMETNNDWTVLFSIWTRHFVHIILVRSHSFVYLFIFNLFLCIAENASKFHSGIPISLYMYALQSEPCSLV